jgi:hypothetical protein
METMLGFAGIVIVTVLALFLALLLQNALLHAMLHLMQPAAAQHRPAPVHVAVEQGTRMVARAFQGSR